MMPVNTEPNTPLSQRLVACKGFRWLSGMLILDHGPGVRFCWADDTYLNGVAAEGGAWMRVRRGTALPDLADPATLGCLLALVREAWANPRLVAIYCEPAHPGQSEGWAVQAADNRLPVAGEDYGSEAEALVAALETAP